MTVDKSVKIESNRWFYYGEGAEGLKWYNMGPDTELITNEFGSEYNISVKSALEYDLNINAGESRGPWVSSYEINQYRLKKMRKGLESGFDGIVSKYQEGGKISWSETQCFIGQDDEFYACVEFKDGSRLPLPIFFGVEASDVEWDELSKWVDKPVYLGAVEEYLHIHEDDQYKYLGQGCGDDILRDKFPLLRETERENKARQAIQLAVSYESLSGVGEIIKFAPRQGEGSIHGGNV